MKRITSFRILLLGALLLGLAACGQASETAPTPEATLQATAGATSTPVEADPEQESVTPEPTRETEDTATGTPAPAPSLADQARARKPAITDALSRMVLPEDGDVVASVNGETITVDELEGYMRLRMDGLATQYDLDWASEEVAALVMQVQSEVTEQLIEMKLIAQGAARDGIVVDDAELAGMAFEVQQSIIQSQGYASWEDYLETVGLSEQSFMDIITQSLLVNGLILAQSTPTEAEQVHARHILVTDPDLAADLVKQIGEGADFAGLAAANSEDTGTAPLGGDLDWFPRGMMVTEFEDAAFALEVGDVSDVVTTTYGFHIIQVLEKGIQPLSEASRQQLQQMAFIQWLDGMYTESDIQRFVLQGVG